MTVAVIVLLVLAAISLGLRTTSVLLSPGVHPITRLAVSVAAGGLITAVVLEVCDSYRVFGLGLGLLVSLSPVGVFDLARWWFKWRNQPQRG
jgi:hypothetical protein